MAVLSVVLIETEGSGNYFHEDHYSISPLFVGWAPIICCWLVFLLL